MAPITFAELQQRFPTLYTNDLGDCVVVPGEEFDPDWEFYLCDEGHKCENTTLDNRPVTLVQVQAALKHKGESAKHGCVAGAGQAYWSAELVDLLKKLWVADEYKALSVKKRSEKLAALPEFQGRSAKAIEIKVYKMGINQLASATGSQEQTNPLVAVEKEIAAEPVVEEVKHGPVGNVLGVVHRGRSWSEEEEKRLLEVMGKACAVNKRMVDAAAYVLPEFPGRSVVAIVQHYKQITTSDQRAAARLEALKPKVQRVLWQPADEKTEKYTLNRDGLSCTAFVKIEKGVITKVSASLQRPESSNLLPALVIQDLPVEVLNLLHELVEQLQEARQ